MRHFACIPTALALLCSLTGCLATERQLDESTALLAAGHEKISRLHAPDASDDEKVELITEVAALRKDADRLVEEGKAYRQQFKDMGSTLGRTVVAVGDFYTSGSASTAISMLEALFKERDALGKDERVGLKDEAKRLAGEQQELTARQNDERAERVSLNAKVDAQASALEGLSDSLKVKVEGVLANMGGLEKKLSTLSQSTQDEFKAAFKRGVDEEHVQNIVKSAVTLTEAELRKAIYDQLELSEESRKEADGLGIEELLALLVTGGASVGTARMISGSARGIARTNERVDEVERGRGGKGKKKG